VGIFVFRRLNLKKNKNFIPVGHKIKAREIRCIDQNNDNLGVVDIKEAMNLARDAGLDLVQISSGTNNVPVCKILDYGKYKYDLSKRNKEASRKQRETVVKMKEIKFRPNTGINDLKVKASQAEKFITNGNKVKITVVFKGRELAHREVGYETLNTFVELISNMELITEPSMQGRILSVLGVKKSVAEKAS